VDRRTFLTGALGGVAAAGAGVTAARAAVDASAPVLRETLNAAELGVKPGESDDQSRALQRLLDLASEDDRQVFLPSGTYAVSELKLPARTRLAGVAGATRLVFAGGRFMLSGEHAELVSLKTLMIDGANQPLAEYVPGIVHLADSRGVAIEDCTIVGSTGAGVALDRSSGRVSGNTITTARGAAIRTIESAGLTIADNTVEDCGNAGIQVWRWTAGDDGTIVTGNRVRRIAARDGGTGQNGNGINIFRAHGVIVASNRLSDCAFTAIRANSANNVQIIGNNCQGCGEVAIYSEFSFEGAMIANNIVDRAATGISVTNFNDGGHLAVVCGNIVRNLSGIGIAVEADTTVNANVVDGAPKLGIQIGWGPYLRDVTATANVIRGAPVGIGVSVVPGAGSAVISDNVIAGADKGAILGMQWGKAASGDLAAGGAARFPHLLVARNRVS
jgi:uncharacterized secreted repeat protein (TIGR03808 family)